MLMWQVEDVATTIMDAGVVATADVVVATMNREVVPTSTPIVPTRLIKVGALKSLCAKSVRRKGTWPIGVGIDMTKMRSIRRKLAQLMGAMVLTPTGTLIAAPLITSQVN